MHPRPLKPDLARLGAALLGALLLASPARADIDLSLLREGVQGAPDAPAQDKAERDQETQGWYERGLKLDRHGAPPAQLAEAADWYRRAAERGHAGAQTQLGLMYLEGRGVPGNLEEAARWLRRAAEAGSVTAQYSLALLYHQGSGVTRDFGEALYWYENAARQGNAGAMNNLAIMHGMGEGVPKSTVEAYAWFALAASHGDANAAENRDLTALEMSDEDRGRAVKRYQQLENQLRR